jgi:AhpD family alkylhydroperoxidase
MSMGHARIGYEEFAGLAPAARAAMAALGKAVDDSGIDKGLSELVKLRASQINGCAFCLYMHLGAARRLGIAPEKIDLVGAWRDADVFSARERAALAWTEALTDVSRTGAPDDAYAALREHFSEADIAHLTVAVATINAWNRIAISLRFAPQTARSGAARS